MSTEDKDRVLLVVGEWVRDSEQKWVFMADNVSSQQKHICLHTHMKLSDLLTGVREQIETMSKGGKVRLSYQYPQWISADGGGMDMPQYITDDTELGVFIELRRSIEEVNLFVSIISRLDGTHDNSTAGKLIDNVCGGRGYGDGAGVEDEEWHEFAMANYSMSRTDIIEKDQPAYPDIPVYSIPCQVSGIENVQSRSSPFGFGGIAIREPARNIRPRLHSEATTGKGKKKMRVETDSDSDADDDMVVPVCRTPADVRRGGKRPMWSRLIFDIPGIPNTPIESYDIPTPSPDGHSDQSSHPSAQGIDDTLLVNSCPSTTSAFEVKMISLYRTKRILGVWKSNVYAVAEEYKFWLFYLDGCMVCVSV